MAETIDRIARESLSSVYGIEGELSVLESEWGGTYRVETSDGQRLLLKVSSPAVDRDRTDMELKALEHLNGGTTSLRTPRVVRTLDGATHANIDGYIVRSYDWIPGRLMAHVNPQGNSLLQDLGASLAMLKNALDGFEHSAAHDHFDWSPHLASWISEYSDQFDLDRLIDPVLESLKIFGSKMDGLQWGVNFNDANDHNIIASDDVYEPQVIGFIDFGDMHFGPLINDLAICLAYIMMGKSSPVDSACAVISGYVQHCGISESELDILLILIKCRLAISVTKGRLRQAEDPQNEYWQVSTQPALELLEQLDRINDHLVLCKFRNAAGYEADPNSHSLRNWLKSNFNSIHPILGRHLSSETVHVFDWSVGSLDMGSFDDIADTAESTRSCFQQMHDRAVEVGVGRYDEPRAVYTSDAFGTVGNNGPEMRSLHIGLDLFMEAGSPLYAPLDGRVVTLCDNEQVKGYGPLIILEHTYQDDSTFYTLYGHCSPETLYHLQLGDSVSAGTLIGWIGDYPENGNWVPHVHFQVMTNMLGNTIDFPGVALFRERPVWLSICPDPNLLLGITHEDLTYQQADTDTMLTTRRELLPGNMSVSHRHPLNIVRGWRSRLYDHQGIGYLDTRNNIAHVGHEAPIVTQAIAAQAAVLNTNTRYLHRERLRLAQRLLATLPDRLRKVFFVNSGSEANDLALRIAEAYTGRSETLVMHQAYHGHTIGTLRVSPYKFEGKGGSGRPEGITILPEIAGQDFVTQQAVAVIPDGNLTFIHESIPSCAGQIMPPKDYFTKIYSTIRSQGGVCIADEVQSGLGRVGSAFWAFDLFGVEPDIVTIGKPLGNGHPVAAVAVTEELALAFDNGMEYFNSFGGNPVSCAAAHAVLEAIEDDQLQDHAAWLGGYWMDSILQLSHPAVADVRGSGLFFGIEIGGRNPDECSQRAKYMQRRMIEHRILTSLDGPLENVIKIKPPLTFSRTEADYFMEVMSKILEEDAFVS